MCLCLPMGAYADTNGIDIPLKQTLNYQGEHLKDIPTSFSYKLTPQSNDAPLPSNLHELGATEEGESWFIPIVGNKTVSLHFDSANAYKEFYYDINPVGVKQKEGLSVDTQKYTLRLVFSNDHKGIKAIYYKGNPDQADKCETLTWVNSYKPPVKPGLNPAFLTKTGDMLYHIVPATLLAFCIGLIVIIASRKHKSKQTSK